jgi:hypothetical protein
MNRLTPRPSLRALVRVGALAALALGTLGAGCLSEPKIEDRWTRLDLDGASVAYGQAMPQGIDSISVQAAITFRRIVTGYAVVELRASTTLTAADVALQPGADRVREAQDIDAILANSQPLGRATRAVTGWDHLIQRLDLGFRANVPAVLDSGGTPAGLFLVAYLADGDKIELPRGGDTLVITPMPSVPNQLLPIGLELTTTGPRAMR